MSGQPYVDQQLDLDGLTPDDEGWVEIDRVEALGRIERMLTSDTVAFELEQSSDFTAIGLIESFTWFTLSNDGEQRAVLLSLREPRKDTIRWFVHSDLIEDQPID